MEMSGQHQATAGLTPEKRLLCPLNMKMEAPPVWCGCSDEKRIYFPTGNRTIFLGRPALSHYIDCSVPTPV